MADEDIEAQFKAVVAAAANLLKPQGFKKRGYTLRRTDHGNMELVEFQRSLTSSAQSLKFTANIGVVSSYLASQNETELARAGSADAHLRRRIGTFLQEPRDKWWELNAQHQPDQVIEEISSLLLECVVPYLDEHSSDTALVSLWETGHAPGLTDTLRARYLSTLKACDRPS